MLDEKLLQERLAQFNPEPLINYDSKKTKDDIEIPLITENEQNIDLAKTNFLNVLDNEDIKKASEDIIRKYGVGTCGPRAFYGTTDVHLELEQKIAEFLGLEESIVYSYGFVAISSSIAAYCKKKDTVFIDSDVNFPIQHGLDAAKCKVVHFDRKNPKSLEEAAQKVTEKENNKKPSRKFLIVEGVSWKNGDVLALPDFLEVAEKYKMRVFLEETYSIGIYGDHGRGLTEHFGIDPTRLDMIIATLECAIGSIGGFCAGSQMAIEHQRLSGNGYIFSASLPTYLVQACIKSIESMGEKPKKLRKFAKEMDEFLRDVCEFNVLSDAEAAFKVFTVKNEENRKEIEKKIHEYCKENGVHFILAENGIVINLNVALHDDKTRLGKVHSALQEAAKLFK